MRVWLSLDLCYIYFQNLRNEKGSKTHFQKLNKTKLKSEDRAHAIEFTCYDPLCTCTSQFLMCILWHCEKLQKSNKGIKKLSKAILNLQSLCIYISIQI